VGGERRQVPGELGVLVDVGLAEEDAAMGVEPGGEQDRGGVVEVGAELGRVPGDGDRVEVDDAVDRRIAPVLALDVLKLPRCFRPVGWMPLKILIER